MGQLSQQLGHLATLDDIPDSDLDELAKEGFDWLWLLSVWQTGSASQKVSRANEEWRRSFEAVLPDLKDEDIAGSGFAITDYVVHSKLGGQKALERFRERLKNRGMKLLLDFVPNHTGLEHAWIDTHPEYYVPGTERDLIESPQNYTRISRNGGDLILAHGRDPYFDGWPDVLQLDYSNPSTQEAMIVELLKVAAQCDAVRCDMAMLVLPDVFERTWHKSSQPFWSKAIQTVRKKFPEFQFMAEVYWDLEWRLQQEGFDYTYDKRLYDRLRDLRARPVREHLLAQLDYQEKMARFLENHDEPRAASIFPLEVHRAAAAITFLSPGLRFIHDGQFDGRRKHISPHLVRAPEEPVDKELRRFYDVLLDVLRQPVLRCGRWRLLECIKAWDNNWTSDCFICFAWTGPDAERVLVAVNYAPNQSQCYVQMPDYIDPAEQWLLRDALNDITFARNGAELIDRGLYLDVPPWQVHLFFLTPIKQEKHDLEKLELPSPRLSALQTNRRT